MQQMWKRSQRVKTWDYQIQVAIPLLQLPQSSDQTVNAMQLLKSNLYEPFKTRCGCKSRMVVARMELELLFFTTLTVGGFNFFNNPPVKLMNKLIVDK